MNALLRTTVLSLSVLGLAACAATETKSGSAYVAPQRSPTTIQDDEEYMAQVERIARRRGIEIIWINVPSTLVATNTDE